MIAVMFCDVLCELDVGIKIEGISRYSMKWKGWDKRISLIQTIHFTC
jgi:hypothetical protein